MAVKKVMGHLRASRRTVYRFAVEPRLAGFKVEANWRFKRKSIDKWIAPQSLSETLVFEAGAKQKNQTI